jgi:hypothetical protein
MVDRGLLLDLRALRPLGPSKELQLLLAVPDLVRSETLISPLPPLGRFPLGDLRPVGSLTLSGLALSSLTLGGLPFNNSTTLVGTSAAPTAGFLLGRFSLSCFLLSCTSPPPAAGFSFGHLAPGRILGGGPSESCLLFRDRVPLERLPLPLRGS